MGYCNTLVGEGGEAMRQTKALKWLSVMQMAKFFSQYGVRGILVLLRRWKSHISPKESFRLHGVGRLPGLLGALVLFFAAEDQICSSLILFAERECDRAFLGWMIPGSVIVSVNPLVILLLGTTIARLRYRFLTPFVMVALSFGALALLCMLNVGLTIFSLMGIAVIVSIAELMVGPLVMSKVSEIAAEGSPGVLWFVSWLHPLPQQGYCSRRGG